MVRKWPEIPRNARKLIQDCTESIHVSSGRSYIKMGVG